jgi:hypothetical protein
MFELQILPAPDGLAALGERVELHELAYGAMRAVMAAEPSSEHVGEALLAASLWVDGEPLGSLEALRELPGRFAGGILRALEACMQMYGLRPGGEAANEDTEPGEA